MKFLLVPDSFKDSLSSREVAEAMRKGILDVDSGHETMIYPIADGGEGSLECIQVAMGGQLIQTETVDAVGKKITVPYLRDGKKAFVELAQASGLATLVSTERSAGKTSTYGTGLQIRHALAEGVTELMLCVGGSATNDAGLGIAAALGVKFLNEEGHDFVPTGDTLDQVHAIRSAKPFPDLSIHILCDVDNPFVGPRGAVHTYAEQKGAIKAERDRLEENMHHLLHVFHKHHFPDVSSLPGAGAAGGVSGGLAALFSATLVSGIDFFLASPTFHKALKACDVVLTGEGKLDHQTRHGKTIAGLTRAARRVNKPVLAICGQTDLTPEECRDLGLVAAYSIKDADMSLDHAVRHAPELIAQKSTELIKQHYGCPQ